MVMTLILMVALMTMVMTPTTNTKPQPRPLVLGVNNHSAQRLATHAQPLSHRYHALAV
jgi:hypothetical protein